MKFFKKLWTVILNLFLLILPVILLSISVYYYGRPIAERFKDFLGNPVTEFISISRHFERQPFPLQLYEHSNQVLHQLSARDELDEESRRQLKDAFFQIHRATIKRMPHADDDDFFDLYEQLLDNPQLDRIYPHPRQLRTLLKEDLERLSHLQDLPFHPAEGIDSYLRPVRPVVETVKEYGQIYGDQYTCQNVYGSDCSVVHDPAVEISSRWIGQYLQTWPELGDRGRQPVDVLAERLEEFIQSYQKLTDEIDHYLKATPWNEHNQLLENHDNFRNNYREDLHRWYSRAVQGALYELESFQATPVNEIKTVFPALKKIEEQIQTSAFTRRLMITEHTGAIRRQAQEHLTELLHDLLAHHRFGPDFEINEEKLEELVTTLEIFPEGTEEINRQRKLLTEIENYHTRLVSALENKDYSALNRLFEQGLEQLDRAQFDGWEIMNKYFLRENLPALSSPQFQPVDREGQDIYVRIIEQVEAINEFLDLEEISAEWREETLLTLRSQRFSQLKSEIIELLEDPRREEIQTVISRLKELITLPELPEALAGQPAKIVLHSSFIEKTVLNSDNIYTNLRDEVDLLEAEKEHFETLVEIIESTRLSREQLLLDFDLQEFASLSYRWLQNFSGSGKLLQLLHNHFVERLENFYEKLADTAVSWTEDTTEKAPPLEDLKFAHDNLKNGLEATSEIEGFSAPYSAGEWLNLLELRERLTNIHRALERVERGGLFRENEPFQRYVTLTNNYHPQTLPGSYRFEYEQRLIGILQEKLIEKAREIEEISRGDWLAGWGGRIRGDNVLEPWIEFLKELEGQIEINTFSRELGNFSRQASEVKQQLEAER